MIITNDDEKYLTTVLGIMNKINVNIQKPPIVSFGDPDIIIIGNIDKKVLIPGDISKVKGLVSDSGIPVIILAQDKILDLGLGNLLPIEFEKSDPITVTDLRSSYNIVPTQPNSYLTPTESLGQTRKIYQTKENDNVITYAYSMKNNYPVITLSSYGLGKVLFYGLFDEYSDFKADSYYPVFWKRVIDLLLGGKTTAEINKQAGYMQILGKEQTVDTPKGKRTGKIVSLDYTGFYRFNTYTIATNILSEEEQRLNKDSITIEASDLSVESKKIQNETRDKEITFILLVIATIFLLAEFILLKFRGDF